MLYIAFFELAAVIIVSSLYGLYLLIKYTIENAPNFFLNYIKRALKRAKLIVTGRDTINDE
jgi:hypothetical protein